MYLDTSVLVKLFVREPDSEFYGKLADGRTLCSSVLAYTELWSALLAKERHSGLSAERRRKIWAMFEQYVAEEVIDLLPMGPAVFKRANHLLQRCHPKIPLRSPDALHLACADQAQDWPLVTHDQRMREAAEVLGYPLSPLPD
jgi:predicted nucleic acid-binding protein